MWCCTTQLSFIICSLDRITGEGKFLTAGDLPKVNGEGPIPGKESGQEKPQEKRESMRGQM